MANKTKITELDILAQLIHDKEIKYLDDLDFNLKIFQNELNLEQKKESEE